MASFPTRTIRFEHPDNPAWNGDVKYRTNRLMERALATIPEVVPEHIRPKLKVTYRYGDETDSVYGRKTPPGKVETLDLST